MHSSSTSPCSHTAAASPTLGCIYHESLDSPDENASEPRQQACEQHLTKLLINRLGGLAFRMQATRNNDLNRPAAAAARRPPLGLLVELDPAPAEEEHEAGLAPLLPPGHRWMEETADARSVLQESSRLLQEG